MTLNDYKYTIDMMQTKSEMMAIWELAASDPVQWWIDTYEACNSVEPGVLDCSPN